jgi:hypothetical protein
VGTKWGLSPITSTFGLALAVRVLVPRIGLCCQKQRNMACMGIILRLFNWLVEVSKLHFRPITRFYMLKKSNNQ